MKDFSEAYTLLLMAGTIQNDGEQFFLEYSLHEWSRKNEESSVFIADYKIINKFTKEPIIQKYSAIMKDVNRSDAVLSIQKGIIALFSRTGKIDSEIFIKSCPNY